MLICNSPQWAAASVTLNSIHKNSPSTTTASWYQVWLSVHTQTWVFSSQLNQKSELRSTVQLQFQHPTQYNVTSLTDPRGICLQNDSWHVEPYSVHRDPGVALNAK